MKKIKSLIEKFVSLPTWALKIIILLLVGVTVSLNMLLKVGCLSKAIFGVPCPVCGMTRAYLSLLRFDLEAAMRYNPAFPVFPIICLFGILAVIDKKRTRTWFIAFVSALLVLIIIWIIRLASGTAFV